MEPPFTWARTFQEELDVVRKRHSGDEPAEKNLVGLAFSGGGIRSATFGLGVLEALKYLGLLKQIDYLSTVSGGGYIGAWLSANCKRTADRNAAADTAHEPEWLEKTANWKDSIDHLRRYSNYLSPQLGLFSADTWSMAMIWLRNTILVQLTVVFAIAVLLLLPRPLFVVFQNWQNVGNWRWTTIILFILGVVGIAANQLRLSRHENVPLLHARKWFTGLSAAAVCLLIAGIIAVYWNFMPFANGPVDYRIAAPVAGLLVLSGFWLLPAGVEVINRLWPGPDAPEQINYSQGWVQAVVVVPMMATGFLVAAVLWGQSQPQSGALALFDTFGGTFRAGWLYWPFPLSVVFVSLWMLSFCSIRSWLDPKCLLAALIAPVPATGVLHALLSAIMLMLHGWAAKGDEGKWLAYIWTPALVLYAFSAAVVILIGMLGRQSSEGAREWWSRFGAWLSIYGFAWMVISLAASYGPYASAILMNGDTWKGITISGGWVGTVLAGVFAGKSGYTSGTRTDNGMAAKAMEALTTVAPFFFIVGLLVGVSTLLHMVVATNSGLTWSGAADLQNNHWMLLTGTKWSVVLFVLLLCFGCMLLLAARVDINEFSLNAFYRSRLSRCYLGATRFRKGERNPQNFTGFDDNDDLPLAALAEPKAAPPGPMHLINCALNLGGSSDLALHTRHSATFTLTPLRCGSRYESRHPDGCREELGYTPTNIYGGSDGQPSLGQAISVSGAAASPNMGYHTSPAVAFMMTVFNARLAWWFPNPRFSRSTSPSPSFSLRYLFKELFGGADDRSGYLAISDGGHFENLAAYELIRRQCRVIIVSDAEHDPDLNFESLGSLIRMCAVDFDTRISIDVGAIRRREGALWSGTRGAVGRIAYPDGSEGTLIYLKASMTGHEDTSILQYKAAHPDFPHESTANQFYKEDQFESYRSLGNDIALRMFQPVAEEQGFIAMADKLRTICSPTLHSAEQFTRHSTRLMDLWSRISGDPELHFMDRELVRSWPDHSNAGFRSAFYLCCEMIQLMENVYLDLSLEDTWGHPDTAGWRVLFETWAQAPALRHTWSLTSQTYGLRFQHFCTRNLHMPGQNAGD